MTKQLLDKSLPETKEGPPTPGKYPRHPITMENTPEETIRRMRSLPERAEKLRELIRGLREADAG